MFTDINTIPSQVQALRDTFKIGITKSIQFRHQQLENLKALIKENEKDIFDAIKKDLRKHDVEIVGAEIGPVLGELEYFMKNLNTLTKPQKVKAQYKMNAIDKIYVRKEPKGVVLIIGAWNYPFHLTVLPLVGAIAAGNCAILKPSELATHTALLLGKLIPEYLDPRAFTVVQGGVEETTVLLNEHFNHIFYTGNGAVGKIVLAAAAKHLTPVTLELGGKSPVIIADDADLRVAANRTLWAKFYNGGQTCVAPDYVLISESRAEEYVKICHQVVKNFFGDNPQTSDSYCRIISERRFDTVKRFLDDLDPSKIVVGGQSDKKDLYIAPTVVYPVGTNEKGLMEEEIFGPILPIVPVEDINEAIDVVNSKGAPLTLYIFTDNKDTREKILNNTQSGSVLVNDMLMQIQELSLPFGGVGPSGMGSYHGIKSFETFTHERSTMIKSSGMETFMTARYPPYSKNKYTLFTLLLFGLPSAFFEKMSFMYEVVGAAFKVQKETKRPNDSNFDSKL